MAIREQHAGTIEPVQPFEFGQSLAFLGEFAPAEGDITIEGRSLTRATIIDRQPIGFRVTAIGDVLRYQLFAEESIPPERRRAAEDRIRFFLSADDNLNGFYALAAGDPPFAAIVAELRGLHQVKFLSPYENACWAVLTQRNPMAMARRQKQAIVDRWGATIAFEGIDYPAFPEAASVAGTGVDEFIRVIGNKQKGGYLAALSDVFADVDEAWLRSGPIDDVTRWLRSIPGIGAWSASFVLIRGLGRMEIDPAGEARLVEAASRLYGRPLDDAAFAALASRYGDLRAYWAHYVRASA